MYVFDGGSVWVNCVETLSCRHGLERKDDLGSCREELVVVRLYVVDEERPGGGSEWCQRVVGAFDEEETAHHCQVQVCFGKREDGIGLDVLKILVELDGVGQSSRFEVHPNQYAGRLAGGVCTGAPELCQIMFFRQQVILRSGGAVTAGRWFRCV